MYNHRDEANNQQNSHIWLVNEPVIYPDTLQGVQFPVTSLSGVI